MSINILFIVVYYYAAIVLASVSCYNVVNKNMQIFSYISKQTDCGLIIINEEEAEKEATRQLFDIEESNIDTAYIERELVANLSSCLNEQSNMYSSYSTHLSSKLSQNIFDEYFHLNEKLGKLLDSLTAN